MDTGLENQRRGVETANNFAMKKQKPNRRRGPVTLGDTKVSGKVTMEQFKAAAQASLVARGEPFPKRRRWNFGYGLSRKNVKLFGH